MNLRNLLTASTAAGIAMLAAGVAQAAAVTQTANATAQIISPITITKNQDLSFGKVAVPTNGSNNVVTIASANNATATVSGAGNGYVASNVGAQAAKFTLNGYTNDSFSSLSATLSTMTDGTNNLTSVGTETPVVASGATGSGTGPYTLTANTAVIYVGAHFTVTPTTPPSTYTGTMTLSLNYP